MLLILNSQFNMVLNHFHLPAIAQCFLLIHLNVVFLSPSCLQVTDFLDVSPPEFCVHFLWPPSELHVQSILILYIHYPNNTRWPICSSCNILNCQLTSFFIDPDIFRSTLFSHIYNLCSSFKDNNIHTKPMVKLLLHTHTHTHTHTFLYFLSLFLGA
jgi:hypothetical protein